MSGEQRQNLWWTDCLALLMRDEKVCERRYEHTHGSMHRGTSVACLELFADTKTREAHVDGNNAPIHHLKLDNHSDIVDSLCLESVELRSLYPSYDCPSSTSSPSLMTLLGITP